MNCFAARRFTKFLTGPDNDELMIHQSLITFSRHPAVVNRKFSAAFTLARWPNAPWLRFVSAA